MLTNLQKLLIIVGKLMDGALAWWYNNTKQYATRVEACNKVPLQKFLDKFHAQYMPMRAMQVLFSKLLNEKQGNRGAREHAHKF